MNQILSVNNSPKDNFKKEKIKNKKVKNNGPIEIDSIVKFFSIAILIFGVFMIGSGSYSMYREMSLNNVKTKPIIYVEPISDTQISLRVTSDNELDKITYRWNEEETIDIPIENKKEIQTKIELLEGVNSLTIRAVDKKGQEIEYNRVYNVESDINIDVEPEGNQLKININGRNQLTYMTYRWDEEEETKLDINSNEFEQTIEIPMGLHLLTINAVDENNKTQTFEQEVNGVKKPNLEVTTDGVSNFIIKASDEQGIKKVEFVINGTTYELNLDSVLPLEERKEFEYSYPINQGENILEVTVYNENDITETFRALVNM